MRSNRVARQRNTRRRTQMIIARRQRMRDTRAEAAMPDVRRLVAEQGHNIFPRRHNRRIHNALAPARRSINRILPPRQITRRMTVAHVPGPAFRQRMGLGNLTGHGRGGNTNHAVIDMAGGPMRPQQQQRRRHSVAHTDHHRNAALRRVLDTARSSSQHNIFTPLEGTPFTVFGRPRGLTSRTMTRRILVPARTTDININSSNRPRRRSGGHLATIISAPDDELEEV